MKTSDALRIIVCARQATIADNVLLYLAILG